MDFDKKGREEKKIPVRINYKIIDLFSAGLYSSPHKAFEELVSNSYDAEATKVSIFVPPEVKQESFIWVCDNGKSMDSNGMEDLWKIGESKKRLEEVRSPRKQIGKFGIGKLATYVLANQLTHLCKKGGKYRMVTMDYLKIPNGADDYDPIHLSERILEENEVKTIVDEIIGKDRKKAIDFELFGDDAEETWTLAVMSNLKELAFKMREWHLSWVLTTALPLNPGFNLVYNGQKLESSKVNGRLLKKWTFGENDEIIEREKDYTAGEDEEGKYVNLPNIQKIRGYIELYENSLVRGKSQEIGRSHGIFLSVRGRLINIDNPLLGDMRELNHAVFNRIRIVVQADELDFFLTSGRESIRESQAYADLQKYISQKFNKAKSFFDNFIEEVNKSTDTSDKLLRTSAVLSKIPLFVTAKRFFSKEIENPYLINMPAGLTEDEQKSFVEELEESIVEGDEKIIKSVSFDGNLCVEDPLARLDLKERKLFINTQHPFFANFIPSTKSSLPFELIAANEILTEASLIEKGVDQVIVKEIMERRDRLFREFTYEGNPNALTAALMLKNALADSSGLEDALFYCFKYLGFDTTKIGGNGEPDGKAIARLGIDPATKEQQTYSFTYEAKSTKKDKIKAGTSRLSACKRHRKKYSANYSIEVAIDFEGAEKDDSAINIEARDNKVSLIRASDLWTLLLNSIPNQLSFIDFKNFLENCHTVLETSKWISNFSNKSIIRKPIKRVLDVIWDLMETDKIETPSVQSIRSRDAELIKLSIEDIVSLLKSLELIVPNQLHIYSNLEVRLLTSPDKIMEAINKVLESEVPIDFQEKFKAAFEDDLNKN